MLLALRQAADVWPARAVHDTVAAIIRDGGYGRTLSQSLLGRLLKFLIDRIIELLALLKSMPSLRLVTIAATVIVVLAIAARLVTIRRLRDTAQRSARAPRLRGMMRENAWTLAQTLAASGRYTEAVHALYAAVVGELAASNAIRLHPSKTSGDYARELRASGAPVATQYRAFSRHLDRVVYGLRECTVEDYTVLAGEARSMFVVSEAA